MKSMGPLWAVALTVDRNLLLVFLAANLAFSTVFVALTFRNRRLLDRALVTVGVFFLLTLLSTTVLYLFAHTPIREVIFFAVD